MRLLPSLAIAGLAAASLEHRQLFHRVRSQEAYVHHRDIRSDTSNPCAILSEVYENADSPKNESLIADVPPSIALACLKSVPVDKKRNLELLEYLKPYISFQSTIELLADPPEEYLLPGVDIWGGFDQIESKLMGDKYESQYDVMYDLRSIFVAAADNHFDYPPALLNTILFVRRGMDFVSLSSDGREIPFIFASIDVIRGNQQTLDYQPSSISDIDGVPIRKWLENDAYHNTQNFQDPDAQFNNLFSTIPGAAAGKAASTVVSAFEIPDNYTIGFHNGSSSVVHNQIVFLPNMDFTGITSGQEFHHVFEVPSKNFDSGDSSRFPDISANDKSDSNSSNGYPTPYVQQESYNSVSGYFLADKEYENLAILSIPSFLPADLPLSELANFNITDYVIEGRNAITKLFQAAQKSGRDKLILDLSANGGGSILLAQEVYRLLFPNAKFTTFDRYRANDAIEAAIEADYSEFVAQVIGQDWPIGPNKATLKHGDNFFGPWTAADQNVTAPFITNLTTPFGVNTWVNGFEPDPRDTFIPEPVFSSENILIITDGTCASACGILTGLLTRNHGIRTLALGGRANNLPMQAMGGVKGTIVHLASDIRNAFQAITSAVKHDSRANGILKNAKDALPNIKDQAPLLPLTAGDAGGRVNGRNGYTHDDLKGYPVHFKYEAANCRLFYTQRMFADVKESWRRAADVAWHGEKCVHGSTVNDDDTIGDETPKYDARVRSTVSPEKGPGSLKK